MRLSQHEALHIINPLRSGTVPTMGLHHYAVGLDRELGVLGDELREVAGGMSHVKGIRGGYGSGKTFIASRLAEDALSMGFVVSKVTLNRDSAPLSQLDKVYHQMMLGLRVRGVEGSALPYLLDRWLDRAEEYVVETRGIPEDDEAALHEAVSSRVQDLLGNIARERPAFAAALSTYYKAHLARDYALKQQVVGWLAADSNVSARGIPALRGRVERKDTLAFLRALIGMIRHTGFKGLLLILDELDEMRKLRRDSRESAWSNLRDLVDGIGVGIPGFYLLLAGTPDVFDSARGFKQLPPLYQRFEDATLETSRPNLRGPQLPLPRFGEAQLVEVMEKLRVIWETAYQTQSRMDDGFAGYLARGWTEKLGDKSPRIAIREFISILDRMRDYEDYDPYAEYRFDLSGQDLTAEEADIDDLEPDETF
jgi:hypothetical protein